REVHKIERNLRLLAPLGAAPAVAPRPTLPTDGAPIAEALARKRERWVMLHPGVSAFGALKAWREARFAELGAALAAEGHRVLFLWGGEAERRLAARLAEAAPGATIAPKTDSLRQLAALLEAADLVVGVDSG